MRYRNPQTRLNRVKCLSKAKYYDKKKTTGKLRLQQKRVRNCHVIPVLLYDKEYWINFHRWRRDLRKK